MSIPDPLRCDWCEAVLLDNLQCPFGCEDLRPDWVLDDEYRDEPLTET